MKKVLLIIFLSFLIFQMVVLAIGIDIGGGAINRTSNVSSGKTYVDKNNPANEDGTITSFEIWTVTDMSNLEVATFFVVSGNNLSTRDSEVIGSVTSGAKRTFVVDLDVKAGDYIGVYFTAGHLEMGVGGVGYWYQTGDRIPCTNFGFSSEVYQISLYGTGTAEGEEEGDDVVFFGCNF